MLRDCVYAKSVMLHFLILQRTALQLSIVRKALEIYLHELSKIDLELKNCLTNEVQKVADLLDSSSDASKLCVIVRQVSRRYRVCKLCSVDWEKKCYMGCW